MREIPQPPVNFNDTMDPWGQQTNYPSTGEEVAASEAKQIEKANVWGFKSINYLDNFEGYFNTISDCQNSEPGCWSSSVGGLRLSFAG